MANRAQRRHGVPVKNMTVVDDSKRLSRGLGGSPGVVIAYPHPVGEVSARFHTSLVDLLVYDSNGALTVQNGRQVKIGGHGHVTRHGGHMPMSSGANIVTARNKIVRAFLEEFPSKPEWLWFIDSDMTFEPNILDMLLEAADPKERPIMGGLCFAMMKGEAQEIVPTLYGFTSDAMPKMIRYNAYPVDQVVQVVGTGAACLLVHRSVFETMRDARWSEADVQAFLEQNPGGQFPYQVGSLKFPPPWPWFQETITGSNWGDSMSEDLTFCLRAAQCGFPTHVDTRAKTGHVKPIVIDETEFFRRLPGEEEPAPTFVTIPVKGKHELTRSMIAQLSEQGGFEKCWIFDNGAGTPDEFPDPINDPRFEIIPAAGKTIHEMWNAGIRNSIGTVTRCNVAILNNDLELGDAFLEKMAFGLRCHPQLVAVCGNYDGREFPETVQAVQGIAGGREDGTGGFAGFQFMVRGEAFQAGQPLFDEQFEFWYGDNDFLLNIEKAGGVYGIVGDAHVVHIGGGSQTAGDGQTTRLADPALQAAVERDRVRFEKKWRVETLVR